jgi:heterotetrameric sarcosine oxidase delta subunit
MLKIPCPWCGERSECEFVAGGQAHVARPPADVDDAAWGDYLYRRDNVKGEQAERWFHAYGCRRWFNVVRDTLTHRIVRAYPMARAARPA